MSMITKDLRSSRNGVPTRPARHREPCPVTQVAKKLLRLSGDAAQWERTYDVLAWAHQQALDGKTSASQTGYNQDTLSAARSIADAETNLRQQQLGAYLNLTLGEIADRLL